MTNRTDTHLEQLLRETFRAHEDLADPDRAISLADAAPTGRRRWPAIVAAAAAVAVVAGGTSYVVARNGEPSPSLPADTTSPTLDPDPRTTEENIEATHEQSAWLLHAVPMPPGSEELTESPTRYFRQSHLVSGPSDPEFTRTTWWTVQVSADEFADWLSTHQPNGLRLVPDEDGGTLYGGEASETRLLAMDGTDAWTRAVVAFSFMAFETELAVRVDTFIGARFARTTFLPEDVTAVSLLRAKRPAIGDDRNDASYRRVTLTDSMSINDLVSRVNELPGSMTEAFVSPCPVMLNEIAYRLRFVSAEGTYRLRLQLGCWAQATLIVDGEETVPTLDPGADFARALDRYLPALPSSFRRR
jgi:hypothetical protein